MSESSTILSADKLNRLETALKEHADSTGTRFLLMLCAKEREKPGAVAAFLQPYHAAVLREQEAPREMTPEEIERDRELRAALEANLLKEFGPRTAKQKRQDAKNEAIYAQDAPFRQKIARLRRPLKPDHQQWLDENSDVAEKGVKFGSGIDYDMARKQIHFSRKRWGDGAPFPFNLGDGFARLPMALTVISLWMSILLENMNSLTKDADKIKGLMLQPQTDTVIQQMDETKGKAAGTAILGLAIFLGLPAAMFGPRIADKIIPREIATETAFRAELDKVIAGLDQGLAAYQKIKNETEEPGQQAVGR